VVVGCGGVGVEMEVGCFPAGVELEEGYCPKTLGEGCSP